MQHGVHPACIGALCLTAFQCAVHYALLVTCPGDGDEQ